MVTKPSQSLAVNSVAERVQKRRSALHKAGLRLVEIWVPDTRCPGFAAECKRQSQLVSIADQANPELREFMDGALSDFDGLTG
jgi:hypothetical protein